jgi:hypothetical protein
VALTTQGKGAFRRFKDQLHEEHPGLLPAWYAFRDARLRGNALCRISQAASAETPASSAAAHIFTASRRGEFAAADPTLGQLLGRTPAIFRDVLAATLPGWDNECTGS